MSEKTPDTTKTAVKAVDEEKVMRIQVTHDNPDEIEAFTDLSMGKHILLANKFCKGGYENDINGAIWSEAFEYLIQNSDHKIFNKSKIHTLWTVHGGDLRKKIRDDDLVLAVLKISLPAYSGPGRDLYRGECSFLYNEGKIGFCWSPDRKVASRFATGRNATESGGTLLKAYAPPSAILSGPNDHSTKQMREFEYTCNPSLLQNIEVENTYAKPS